MSEIKGLEGLTNEEINIALENGAKFVVFRYTISVVLMTFRRNSDIYFIQKDESTFNKSIGFSIINLLLGWWGIPWGPIYTIGSWITNAGGGKDVTAEVLHTLNGTKQEPTHVSDEVLDDILID